MRKKSILSIFLCCTFLGTASMTYAYLTDQDQAVNELSIADNTIQIMEKFEPPDEILPGTVITKAPSVVNESEDRVYVRMAVYFSDSDAEAFCEPLAINEKWRLSTDGYYYYSEPLESGQTTETLFDRVVIKDTAKSEELIPFDLLVYAESVQSYGMEMDEAWKSYTGGSI